jgi:MFS family permease
MGLLVVGFFGMFFLGALYLQDILGYSPLEVGLAFLPACIVMGTLSLGFAERLIMGFGPRPTLIAGLASAAAGLLLFTQAPTEASWVTDIAPVMVLLGMGAGLAFPALMTLAMSGATDSDSGLASGLVNTTTQVGGAIGLAVLATLATERTDALLADGTANAAAVNSGYHLAYLIGAVLTLVAVVVAIAVLRSDMPEAAAQQTDSEGRPVAAEPAYSEAA